MADNDIPEAQVSQAAVLEGKVSDPYEMQPTQVIDLARRQAELAKSAEDRQAERDKAFDDAATSPYADAEDNTESLDQFQGTSPEYQNYGGVSHEPMEAEGGPEQEATERILKAQEELTQNSKRATGGHTNYGEAAEADPLGRSGSIVRGGTGDVNTATGNTTPTPTPASTPAKAGGAGKKAAAAKE